MTKLNAELMMHLTARERLVYCIMKDPDSPDTPELKEKLERQYEFLADADGVKENEREVHIKFYRSMDEKMVELLVDMFGDIDAYNFKD